MHYQINCKDIQEKNIYSLGAEFCGNNGAGEEISFTNFYMEKNGKPFFGISGELHFSRMHVKRWEDEILKMKMAKVNIISTYLFWIHHEEEEGCFDFSGQRDIQRFVKLCKKHGMYVILRVGPFDHGEVRNGGLPDWLYGKPFEVRSLDAGFLEYTKRLYTKIAEQVKGLFYQDNGPIIGVQIDNEYMHSSAPWERTTGTSNEWVFGGNEGEAYMTSLRDLALECGLTPAFFTCTGWGGAMAPKSMIPLWGGYAFRPWLFYARKGDHPATEEYVYQNFHKNGYVCNYDFHPGYEPEEKPYSCCEMGGGMFVGYNYRFQLPYQSVDAMANIKIGSGCNFLGYYMFHGGSNPVGKHGMFLNEGQVAKINYDFQAALGEFGQIRDSYRRTKTIHQFVTAFGERLCGLQTVLPEGASWIDPRDGETLRYAVRTDGTRGFLFVNNYQDHAPMLAKKQEQVRISLLEETLEIPVSLSVDENAIFPFHFAVEGMDLCYATLQPVTRVMHGADVTYVFMAPDGSDATFLWEDAVSICGGFGVISKNRYEAKLVDGVDLFQVKKGTQSSRILVIDRRLAKRMYQLEDTTLLFTEAAVLEDARGVRLETTMTENHIAFYPSKTGEGILSKECVKATEKKIDLETKQIGQNRYLVKLPKDCLMGCKDVRLQMDYVGDIGHAFINGRLIHDQFYNGATWEIGLADFEELIQDNPITIYITPLKEGANVNVESAMAGRMEEITSSIGELKSVRCCPVYEIRMENLLG